MAPIAAFTPEQGRVIWDAVRNGPAGMGGMSPIFRGGQAFEKPFRYKFEEGAETFPAYGIGEPFGVENAGEWTLRVRKPTGDDRSFYVINTNMTVVSGSSNPYGLCYFLCANPQYALYDDGGTGLAPAFGEMWGPASASYKLTQHRCGFMALGGATGGSTDTALFTQLTGPILLVGKSDAAIAKGATGTVSRWSGSTLADSGINDTVTNSIGAITAAGKWCYYYRPHGANTYHLIQAEC